jgi:uncharacterized membrane protein YagU involved in acid resistance
VVALGATNVVGAVLFGALYATAGARLMSQVAFLACLGVIFVLMTTLWVRVESRHRQLGFVARFGRATAGLVLVVLLVPALVLMPAFWLERQLPPDAGFNRFLGPIMTLVLIALVLVLLVNVVGGFVAVTRAARRPAARVQ